MHARTGVAAALERLASEEPPQSRGRSRGGDWETSAAFVDPERNDIETLVEDVADILDMTDAELVASLVLLERALWNATLWAAPASRLGCLFIASAFLAVKVWNDEQPSARAVAKALAAFGYAHLTPRRLAEMERLVLQAVHYRVEIDAAQLAVYAAAAAEEGRRRAQTPRGEEG